MGAACVEPDFYQRQGVGLVQHGIIQRGFPHALAHSLHHVALVVGGVPEQEVGQGVAVLFRMAPQHRQILLGDLVGRHGGGQLAGDLLPAGEYHYPAGNAIQPVYGGDVVLFPQRPVMLPQQGGHAGGLGIVLRQHPHRLDGHHKVFILIEYVHRHQNRRPRSLP